jgi:hypothetical protein
MQGEGILKNRITGSCSCGEIQYIITGRIKSVVNCHCDSCKKMTGAAFETIALVNETDIAFTNGEDALTAYQITERAKKYFCRHCGTPIYNLNSKIPRNCMVHIGSLDTPAMVKPTANLYCESMLQWAGEISALACYEREHPR